MPAVTAAAQANSRAGQRGTVQGTTGQDRAGQGRAEWSRAGRDSTWQGKAV